MLSLLSAKILDAVKDIQHMFIFFWKRRLKEEFRCGGLIAKSAFSFDYAFKQYLYIFYNQELILWKCIQNLCFSLSTSSH